MAPGVGVEKTRELAAKKARPTLRRENKYNFIGCISEVFEPYLKSYSEDEERKII